MKSSVAAQAKPLPREWFGALSRIRSGQVFVKVVMGSLMPFRVPEGPWRASANGHIRGARWEGTEPLEGLYGNSHAPGAGPPRRVPAPQCHVLGEEADRKKNQGGRPPWSLMLW